MLEEQPVLHDAHEGRRRDLDARWRRTSASAVRCCAAPGVDFDLRRAQPYSSYEDFEFRVPVETAGDCHARYLVRMVEFRESIRIVRQVLDGLPEGPISSRPGVKSLAQVKVPKGEAYARVEGPRGEVGCYLVADGTNKPYRMKWRGASFSNLAVLPHILPGRRASPTSSRSWARSIRSSARWIDDARLPPVVVALDHRREPCSARCVGHPRVRHAARAEVRGAPAVAHRSVPRRAARPAAADRRRRQAAAEGRLDSRRAPIGRSSTSRRSSSWCRAC